MNCWNCWATVTRSMCWHTHLRGWKVYGYRVRMMLSHDQPPIPGYDQDVMVAGMAHNERPITMLLEELRRMRGLNIDLYLRSRGRAWERFGIHGERGEESVGLTIRLLAGHDVRHYDQIERTLAEVQAQTG